MPNELVAKPWCLCCEHLHLSIDDEPCNSCYMITLRPEDADPVSVIPSKWMRWLDTSLDFVNTRHLSKALQEK